MALPSITIQGKVLLPNGLPALDGQLFIKLSFPGSVSDGAVANRVGGRKVVAIESDGSVSFSIIPNADITVGGAGDATWYEVTYKLRDADGFMTLREYWVIASSPGTQDIGDLVTAQLPPFEATPIWPLLTSLPTPAAAYYRKPHVLALTNENEAAIICLKDRVGAYVWRYMYR